MYKLITALICLFILTSVFAGVYINRLENQIIALKALPGKITTTEILVPDSSLARKYSEVVNKLSIADIENDELKKTLKATKAKLKEITEITALYQDSLLNITTSQDSLNDSIRVFNATVDDFRISGDFRIYDPYTINLRPQLDAKINIYATQDKNGVWAVYGESLTKGLKIETINSRVVPRKVSWYETLYFSVGAINSENPGVDLGLGTNKYGAISYGITENNRYWRYSYNWYPFRKIK